MCPQFNYSSHWFLAICYLLTVSKSWLSPSTPHPACPSSLCPCRGVWIYTKQAASKLLSCVKQDNHAVSRIQLIHQDSCDDHSLTPSPHQYPVQFLPRTLLTKDHTFLKSNVNGLFLTVNDTYKGCALMTMIENSMHQFKAI